MLALNQVKIWLKTHPSPRYQRLFAALKSVRAAELPTPRIYNQLCYGTHQLVTHLWGAIARQLYHTPAFKARTDSCGSRLYLYGGIPFVSGPLKISIGDNCRISGQTTFSGRNSAVPPRLDIGNNVGIGWQTTIAVAGQVSLGDNVRIAGQCFLFGYSGHPLDARRRALGEPDDESQTGDIILERDVWLGSKVCVKSGVTIGEGTVVATGSVVTRDLPPFVIAAGNPARVIRPINQEPEQGESHA